MTQNCYSMGCFAFQLLHDVILLFFSSLGSGAFTEAPTGTSNVLELQDDYANVKKVFVRVATEKGSPTLGEVKDLCLDMLAGVFTRIPQRSHLEKAIEQATTMEEMSCIVCFNLSNWISYDFLRIVITHFQPALNNVAVSIMETMTLIVYSCFYCVFFVLALYNFMY